MCVCVCVHHNTVDTNAQVALQQLQKNLLGIQHSLFAFERFFEFTSDILSSTCSAVPDLVCAGIGCVWQPARSICETLAIIHMFIMNFLMIGLGIAYEGKPIPHQSVYDLYYSFSS